ncbi:inorganic phosphate transporter, partial [Patescibacteria group bacterium]|nr:inorganic phosphate transporter [Patescibacteria group bacterium]
MPSFELLAIICLIALAFGDLFVGVVNDAVNFLNSAIGSKVSSKKVIIGVAAVGILIGATFSDGIIEVARKGIFHPEMFGATEAIIIFTAVAFADIILLDLYSTFGLPTSTTVSLVFELLGAAFILALWKMGGISEAWTVINSESAIKIIVGIVMSIGVAFVAGLVVQFLTRLWFSFDYKEKFKRWGGVWSGIALSCLVLFVLMKGAAHASFMTGDVKEWIGAHTFGILGGAFVIFLV